MIKKNIIVANLNITYYQSSTFEPKGALVFLHGWQSQALHLKSIFENLDNYIAIDLPGFGLSEQPKAAWAATEYAAFLEELLRKLDVSEPTLIGHSFGGSVLIKYLSNGGQAKKIILIDASGVRIQTPKKIFFKLLTKSMSIFTRILPASTTQMLRKRFYSAINSSDYLEAGNLKESYLRIISEDLQTDMQKVDAPTTLIWGSDDRDVPLTYAKIMNDKISNSKLYAIPEAGHFPFIDQPNKFKEIFSKEINAD